MSEAGAVKLHVYDLEVGTSISGLLVGTGEGQLGVFSRWSRDFAWNHPAAAVLDSELMSRAAVWRRVSSVEVARTHNAPDQSIATVTLDGTFDAAPPLVGDVADRAGVDEVLGTSGDWTTALAVAHPVLAALGELAPDPVGVALPSPDAFAPADFVEHLHGRTLPPHWRLCQLLKIC